MQLVTRFGSVTRRMHNKTFTADNQVTILGGRNIGNAYFGADSDVSFGDLDVALIGAVVDDVSQSFDVYWNHPLAYPISSLYRTKLDKQKMFSAKKEFDDYLKNQKNSEYAKMLLNSDLAANITQSNIHYAWSNAMILVDEPDKIQASRDQHDLMLFKKLKPYFMGVKKELIVVSPYFVPGGKGVNNFVELVKRGVSVKILTNSLASTDVEIVHAGYSRYRKDLLKGGVQIYEMKSKLNKFGKSKNKYLGSSKSSLHAKYFIMDRKYIFIGSLNLDPRSVFENTEIGVLITDKGTGRVVAERFDNNIMDFAFKLSLFDGDIVWSEKTEEGIITLMVEPNTNWWQRFKLGVLSWMPGESQL